jgi:tol-pal system beta propeller repeat protein TolB
MRPTCSIRVLLISVIFVVATAQPPRSSTAALTFFQYLPLVDRADLSRIAYVASDVGCPCPLAIMYPDGTLIRTLISFLRLRAPAWSPDGTKLLFAGESSDPAHPAGIYRIDADGTDLIQIVPGVGLPLNIAWSPDGQQIAFDMDYDIFRVQADGSGITQLTRNAGTNTSPTWAPDGQHIAFASTRDGTSALYVMTRDGADVHRIGSAQTAATQPAWSPDGMHIAFTSPLSNTSTISVMNADGSNAHVVVSVEPPLYALNPTWSPDGSRIVFERVYLRYPSLAMIRSDGSDLHMITGGSDPAWGSPSDAAQPAHAADAPAGAIKSGRFFEERFPDR